MLYLIYICVVALCVYLYRLITRNYGYWEKKNVFYVKPMFFFGNYFEFITLKKTIGQVGRELCQRFPHLPYIGTYIGTEPALLIQDPEMLKLVMAKDFHHFTGRDVTKYTHRELVTQCLFFTGEDQWRVERKHVVNLFTLAKLKNMFYMINDCGKKLEKMIVKETSPTSVINVKSLITRFAIDCICSCGYGIDADVTDKSMNTNPFSVVGDRIMCKSKWRCVKLIWRNIWPYTFYKLGLNVFSVELYDFFYNIFKDVSKARDCARPLRHDYVDLLLSWKNIGVLTDTSTNNKIADPPTIEVTDKLFVTNCLTFFAAGFETSSVALSLTIYELAKNDRAQSKLVVEVDSYMRRNEGKIDHNCVIELPYLEACVNEGLRMYPVFDMLTREVTDEYTFPTGLHLDKGLRIHIPVAHLHFNPKLYPEPEKFRPERFLGEEKKNITPYTYLAYGDGMRLCVGVRLAKMITAVALLNFFKKFTVEVTDDTPKTIEFIPGTLISQINGDIPLKINSRQ